MAGLGVLVQYKNTLFFTLYILGFTLFVATLRRGFLMYQMRLFFWTHCVVVFTGGVSMCMRTVYNGMVWAVLAIMLGSLTSGGQRHFRVHLRKSLRSPPFIGTLAQQNLGGIRRRFAGHCGLFISSLCRQQSPGRFTRLCDPCFVHKRNSRFNLLHGQFVKKCPILLWCGICIFLGFHI